RRGAFNSYRDHPAAGRRPPRDPDGEPAAAARGPGLADLPDHRLDDVERLGHRARLRGARHGARVHSRRAVRPVPVFAFVLTIPAVFLAIRTASDYQTHLEEVARSHRGDLETEGADS